MSSSFPYFIPPNDDGAVQVSLIKLLLMVISLVLLLILFAKLQITFPHNNSFNKKFTHDCEMFPLDLPLNLHPLSSNNFPHAKAHTQK
jgi:hypothetical protein